MAREYNQTETKTTMVERNDRGDYVKVCRLIPPKDSKQLECIDIRNYYTSDQDGKLYPTQKGVRISSEMTVETAVAMLRALSEHELAEVYRNMSDRQFE
jgi:hypothetical protein